ncbi:hypothetical protein B7494_g2968 [Chlorociboria aeruginascens]|nr:hypothetical protein B7494_g2968 [Chlorociboria aeruginascens]
MVKGGWYCVALRPRPRSFSKKLRNSVSQQLLTMKDGIKTNRELSYLYKVLSRYLTMAEICETTAPKVKLSCHQGSPGAYEILTVITAKDELLKVPLRCTIRVPDTGIAYNLPLDLGAFPIYNVNDYTAKLPKSLVAKGGVFIPTYQREAMWVKFDSSRPFAVKLYVGGINAISGESMIETEKTTEQQKKALMEGKPS